MTQPTESTRKAEIDAAIEKMGDDIHTMDGEDWAAILNAIDENALQDIYEAIISYDNLNSTYPLPDGLSVDGVSTWKHSAVQYTYAGTFTFGGRTFAFELEDGINNGTVWRSLEPGEEAPVLDEEHMKPTQWALAPNSRIVEGHRKRGTEHQLLQLWDSFLTREPYESLIRKYTYDRFVSPTNAVEKHYHDIAAKAGFEIVSEEDAQELRASLAAPKAPAPEPEEVAVDDGPEMTM